MLNFLKFLIKKDVELIPFVCNNICDDWIELKNELPPFQVVLAACDTYDCGWSIDTVWWNEDDKCWMTTGSVQSQRAHLPYTHWRHLPPPPNK